MGNRVSAIDWTIAAAYLGALVLYGLVSSRRSRSPADYFLASRSARWPTIGLSLIASNLSSSALVGLAGGAYAFGISVYNYEWVAIAVLAFFCVFLLPQVLASRVFTMPEFLERRYDGRARTWLSAITLGLNVFVDGAGALYSGALVCRLLRPEWPLATLTAVLACAAGLYTVVGGLRAVLRTEVVQGTVLVAGAAGVAWFAFAAAGGWHAVMSHAPPDHLSLIRPHADPSVPWPGLVLGVPLLGFYYWCANQVMVQRVLSARDLDEGRTGALFAGLLKLPVLVILVLPGICALLLYPGLGRADLVYPTLVLEALPDGLRGLVVGAFLAATVTSVASMLNSAATLITMDLAHRALPGLPDARIVTIGRLATGACLVVAMAWAPQLEQLPSLWQYLQAVLAYVVPPIVVLFVAGLFWRGATADGASLTFALGTLCGAALFVANGVLHLVHIHFLYVAPLLCAVDFAILVAASRWSGGRAPGEQALALHWSRAAFRAESERLSSLPGWRSYRVRAVALLLATAVVVFAFR
ncbi:MAG: sodium/solute symporter [Proteobacteria bacterium]|nr:sodium/solute symporter [Pseudomonadota bacterium]